MKANITHCVTSSWWLWFAVLAFLHGTCIGFNTDEFERLDFDVEDTDSYVLTPFEYVHIKTSSMREACSLHASAIMLHSLNLLTVICLAVIIKGYESRYWQFSPADPTSQ